MTVTDPEHLQTPPGYESWDGGAKAAWLWSSIEDSAHEPTTLPPLRLPFSDRPIAEMRVVLQRSELEKALDREDDLMEAGRPKIIHARGAVAQVEFETDPESPFTGLLGPPPAGGGSGLLRMSLVAKVKGKAAVTPALALKLFVDGLPSADLLAMNHTVGQGRDFDLFSNTMTNDLTHKHRELRPPQKIMSILFERVSRQPRRLVVDHLVERHSDGSAVSEPAAPDRLRFTPTSEAREIFVGQAGVDFRVVLAGVPTGTVLYEVEGVTGSESVPFARLRMTSRFVSSDAGDRLYFRHVQDPADRIRS